jgi:hypothetical protein
VRPGSPWLATRGGLAIAPPRRMISLPILLASGAIGKTAEPSRRGLSLSLRFSLGSSATEVLVGTCGQAMVSFLRNAAL